MCRFKLSQPKCVNRAMVLRSLRLKEACKKVKRTRHGRTMPNTTGEDNDMKRSVWEMEGQPRQKPPWPSCGACHGPWWLLRSARGGCHSRGNPLPPTCLFFLHGCSAPYAISTVLSFEFVHKGFVFGCKKGYILLWILTKLHCYNYLRDCEEWQKKILHGSKGLEMDRETITRHLD